MKPRFLPDEHISRAVQRQLRRLEPQIEVLAIGDPDAPAKGTSDLDILEWLEENQFILITENRSTIPDHLTTHYAVERHIFGIFWIRPDSPLGRVTEELYLIWHASTAEEYKDRTLFIPL